MQINDLLSRMGGLQSVARELGISEAQATNGAAALLPAILGGFKKQAQTQPAGLEGLGGLLGGSGGAALLDQVLGPEPTNVTPGNNLLGQIFGSKDVSRAVAQNAAAQSGLTPDLLKKMLPLLTMLVGGYLARQQSAGAATSQPAQGGLGGLLGGLLGGKAPGGTGVPAASASGLAAMLDLDRDGNPLDDILSMVGKVTH